MSKKVCMEELFGDFAVVPGHWIIMDSVILLARTCVKCNEYNHYQVSNLLFRDRWLGMNGRAYGQCCLLNRLFPELSLCLNTDCSGLFVSIDIAGYEFTLDEVANYYE